MENVKERKYLILGNIFAVVALLSLLAPYSIYKLPGLHIICMLLLVSSYFVYSRSTGIISYNRTEMVIFGCAWLFVYMVSLLHSGAPSLYSFFSLLYGIFFLSLTKDLQKIVIRRFLWLLAIILLLGIIEYVIFQFANVKIVLAHVTRTTVVKSSYFVQLVFNLISERIIPRFQSLADEPGRIGTLCGFLLFFTHEVRSLRFPFYVFLVGGILSFSLAFYVLLFFFLLTTFRFNIVYVMILLFISIMAYQVLKENIDMLLLSRIDVENVEDLDNRTTDTFDHYFNKAYKNGQLWFGVGAKNLPSQITLGENGGNAGAKNWIFQYGIIGFLVVFLAYNVIYKLRLDQKMSISDRLFLLIFWLSFYQRSSIIDPFTVLAFFAMPIRNNFEIESIDSNALEEVIDKPE